MYTKEFKPYQRVLAMARSIGERLKDGGVNIEALDTEWYESFGMCKTTSTNLGNVVETLILSGSAGVIVDKHYHSFNKWVFVIEGKILFYMSGLEAEMVCGDREFIKRGDLHSMDFISNSTILMIST